MSLIPKNGVFGESAVVVGGALSASGVENDLPLIYGRGLRGEHAGSDGLYDIFVGGGVNALPYLSMGICKIGANAPSAAAGWSCVEDLNSWDGSSFRLQVYKNGVRATATLTAVAKASLADSDYFTLLDAQGTSVVFELDVAGDGVTVGRTQIDVSGATSAADVAALVHTAINASSLDIVSVDNADGTLTLTMQLPGTVGNVTTPADNVANAGWSTTNFTSGSDSGAPLAANLPANTYVQVVAIASPLSSEGGQS